EVLAGVYRQWQSRSIRDSRAIFHSNVAVAGCRQSILARIEILETELALRRGGRGIRLGSPPIVRADRDCGLRDRFGRSHLQDVTRDRGLVLRPDLRRLLPSLVLRDRQGLKE